jgi:pseudouridine synthase
MVSPAVRSQITTDDIHLFPTKRRSAKHFKKKSWFWRERTDRQPRTSATTPYSITYSLTKISFCKTTTMTMRIPSAVGSAISKLLSHNGQARVFTVQSRLSWRSLTTTALSLDEKSPSTETTETLRLSKLLSQHGNNLAMSRREAERLIKSGDVTVAGQVVLLPQMLVNLQDLNNSVIKVQGKPVRFDRSASDASAPSKSSLSEQKTRTWVVHKLPREVVSEFDPQGRPSMLERLRRGGVGKSGKTRLHLKPIGRLDMSTEGLILVTNDGQYAREMELPSSKLHRTYRVRAHGILSDYKLGRIRKGISVDGVRYAPMKVHVESKKQTNSTNKWLQVTCCEGKNRMIRNVFTHLGCK